MRTARLSKHFTLIALALLVGSMVGFMRTALAPQLVPDFEALCASGEPYFVAASYRGQSASNRAPDASAPSILLFQDSPRDNGHFELATFRQTGSVWGLAYDRQTKSVFAATYHKRGMPYGTDGPGGIYRIDMTTGVVSTFAVVPNAGSRQRGGTMSGGQFDHDPASGRQVGKTGLGDLDLSDDGTELFVMNLDDRLIYRYDVATGKLLGSFPNGAVQEPWNRDARPFALAYWQGHVYHGVVNARGGGSSFVAKVYRSMPDGSDMTEVADLPLRYRRDSVRLRTLPGSTIMWGPWSDAVEDVPSKRDRLHVPQPMLTDIVFAPDGTMSIAFRDRYWDIVNQWVNVIAVTATVIHGGPVAQATPDISVMAETGLGFGDMLRGVQNTDGYTVTSDPEYFDDRNGIGHGESAMGGLACVANSMTVAATAYGVERANSDRIVGEEGVYWFDVQSGNRTGQESLSRPGAVVPYERHIASPNNAQVSAHGPWFDLEFQFEFYRDVASLGDIETLCGACVPKEIPPTPTEAPSDTPTPEPPTPQPSATPVPSDTPPVPTVPPSPTAVPSVPVPTPEPGPIYLPLLLREQCDAAHSKADVVLVIDASQSMAGDKVTAAKGAAVAFVRQMRLPEDRVGVVAFNTAGYILSPLSGDAAAVEAAIASLTLSPGTRIDVGLSLAISLLNDVGQAPDRSQAVIVLTDGLQSERPELPVMLAGTLRDRGVSVFAVGLGDDVDINYLGQLTEDPTRIFVSPKPEDLSAVYVALARLIPCPAGAFWAGR